VVIFLAVLWRFISLRMNFSAAALSRSLVTRLSSFALVIHRPPEIAHLAAHLHVDLVEAPSPVTMGAHPIDPLPADLGGEHRAEAVPPIADGLVAEIDAALVQQVLDVAQRQRVLHAA
jgi:hypothetical protein